MDFGFHARPSAMPRVGTLFLFLLLGLLVLAPRVAFAHRPGDDQFGLSYDSSGGGRTAYIPSGAAGIYMSYSDSTSGVSCSNSNGFIAAVDGVLVSGGSPQDAQLEASVALGCTGSGTDQWNVQWGYYDNNGHWHGGMSNYTIATLSTSTYSTLSGYIEIYYTGSCWYETTYVSQVSFSYHISSNNGCYPSSLTLGTTVATNNNDWTVDETDSGNGGESLSTLSFQVTSPEFYVSSSWQD